MKIAFASRAEWSKSRRQPPSTKLSDHAASQEIADIRAKLIERFRTVSGENAEDRKFKRSVIRQAIKSIDRGQIPSKSESASVEDLLATIRSRYEAARNKEPDDEETAWCNELARRAELEARYGSAA